MGTPGGSSRHNGRKKNKTNKFFLKNGKVYCDHLETPEISDISTNSRSRMRLTSFAGRDAAGLKGPDRAKECVGMAEEGSLEDAAASSSSP